MASNMSFSQNVSSGFNGFVQLFTPSILRRGSQPIADEKSAPLDQDRSFEEIGDISHREILGNQNQNLSLDFNTIYDSTGNDHRYQRSFDPPLVRNDIPVVSCVNNTPSLEKDLDCSVCCCHGLSFSSCRSLTDSSLREKHADPHTLFD